MTDTLTPGMVKLIEEPSYAQLVTLNKDGSPQLTQLWVDTDGQHILFNVSDTRQKTKNVKRNPNVTLQVIDPANAWRLINVDGRVVEVTKVGADAHIDKMAKKYLGQDSYPWRNPQEQRLIMKVLPEKVRPGGVPLD